MPASLRESLRRSTGPKLDVRRDLTDEEESRVLHELTPDLIRLRDEYGIDATIHWGIDLG